MSDYKNFLKNFEKSIIASKRNIEEVELIAVSKKKAIDIYFLLLMQVIDLLEKINYKK